MAPFGFFNLINPARLLPTNVLLRIQGAVRPLAVSPFLRWVFSGALVFAGLVLVGSFVDGDAHFAGKNLASPFSFQSAVESSLHLSSQTSFDPVFVAKVKAVENAKSAAEFLRVTANVENYSFQEYSRRLYLVLRDRLGSFLRHSPTVDQVNTLRLRIRALDLDLNLIRAMVPRVSTASEFIQLIRLFHFDPARAERNRYFIQLRIFLKTKIEFFLKLEPTIDELNTFRLQLSDPDGDIKLMEFAAPKMTWARDFAKMVSLFDCKVGADGRVPEYSAQISSFLKTHVEMFMQLRPNTEELNKYRKCMGDLALDTWMLAVGLGNSKSAQEMIDLATAKQEGPSIPPTAYDRHVMDTLVKHIDLFLWLGPSLAQIKAYRIRMADPNGDLKILDASLGKAQSAAEALALIGLRPQVFTEEFNKAWSQVLARHLSLFISWRPSEEELHAYIDRVFDREIAEKMRTEIRSSGLTF